MDEKDKIKFSTSPTKNKLTEIENWLIEEENFTGDGFYCNWEIICSSYEKENLLTISVKNQAIGFITWKINNKHVATIEITEIKPAHRGKGYGKRLISKLIQYLITHDVYVVQLKCAPLTSEPIWRHLGFIDFPEHSNKGNKELYKIIVPHLELQKNKFIDESIELWDQKPYSAKGLNSTWKWGITFKEGTRELKNPIIHPCHRDWRIRWSKGDKPIKDNKVKYFGEGKIEFYGFLIIKELLKSE